ncbi:sodium-dependent transporter [Pseudoalteromonas rubra]|uniref:Transporter n=1 Tax=Pseudoalteromonas rubra TaxID=43658 RepID=A0A0F4QLQ2_9GAMM|nr:sodium-dependent transporter [Pseudoalteromonas rubra]KJZ08264.1 sodium:calcium symporter [Pseudoalteromonas rubra]
MIRPAFSSRIGFIFAAAGSAVGLGNIWKFPFETGANGGAVFVLIYLGFCFLLCYPVMVAEIAIGRHTRRNAVGAFSVLGFPRWKLVGLLGVLCAVLILSFYNVIAAWVIGYLFEMLRGNFAIGDNFSNFTSDAIKITLYAGIFMALTTYVVSKGVSAGIESAAKFLMPALVVVMIGMSLYGLSLPGASNGVVFYLMPDFSAVNLSVVYAALGQAFFSLSLGMGTLMTLGSYLPRQANIVSSSAMVTLADVGIALMAGLLIFPLVFSQGLSPTGGEALIFEALPRAFESFGPVTGSVLGSGFFLLLAFAALTSTVSMLEVPTSYLVDEFSLSRKTGAVIAATLIFIISIPSLLSAGAVEELTHFVELGASQQSASFMRAAGMLASDTLLPVGGFCIAVFSAYVWCRQNLKEELTAANVEVSPLLLSYLNVSLRYVCPLLLAIVVVVTVAEGFFGIPFF